MRFNRFVTLAGIAVAFATAPTGTAAIAATAPPHAREVVGLDGYAPGTIVIKTSERRLYFVYEQGHAFRYRVGVGKPGKAWVGTTTIAGKHAHPAWSPPAEIRQDKPNLPDVIPGGTPENPMGEAALVLSGGEYAIHGTNQPKSIGGFVSYGCIRMLNSDIVELYRMVDVGTPVIVLK
jgi:lipoprotein-anchoring transpeptidase ErfK/SrfK